MPLDAQVQPGPPMPLPSTLRPVLRCPHHLHEQVGSGSSSHPLPVTVGDHFATFHPICKLRGRGASDAQVRYGAEFRSKRCNGAVFLCDNVLSRRGMAFLVL